MKGVESDDSQPGDGADSVEVKGREEGDSGGHEADPDALVKQAAHNADAATEHRQIPVKVGFYRLFKILNQIKIALLL